MGVIVLEGPDGAGKTTLAENIRRHAGRRYFAMVRHSCRPLTFRDAELFTAWIRGLNPKLDVVVDRHPLISEPIYGPILRGVDLLDCYSFEDRVAQLEKRISKIVYCRPSVDTILRCVHAEPQLQWVIEKIDLLIMEYDNFFRQVEFSGRIPVIRYDWEKDSVQSLIEGMFS